MKYKLNDILVRNCSEIELYQIYDIIERKIKSHLRKKEIEEIIFRLRLVSSGKDSNDILQYIGTYDRYHDVKGEDRLDKSYRLATDAELVLYRDKDES